VNHIDTAASYGDSELRIAPWLKQHPGSFFVATKTDARDYKGAKEGLHRSLDRLGVDHVDLLQLHNLVDVIEWEFALREDGALEAAVEAREEGLVRFIGVTGHGLSIPAMHRRSLARFPFDSVLLPYNFRQMQDERYAGEFEALAATCEDGGVAMQTIKAIALAVHWVLGREGVFLNTAGDVNLLPLVLAAAEEFTGEPPSDERMDELVQRHALRPLFV
jgi:aryl-alcohol dehydrogenase-like predicted oxidoreductase